MNRVIEQRLSPQYVSIHATDTKTRAYLLGVDEKRADISDKLQRLLAAGIQIHAQIVLCPEINDGSVLEETLRDLAALYPDVMSVAIVPVALTRYNTDKRLTRVTPEFCRRTIREVGKLQRDFRRKLGATFAFLGDEIYIKAGLAIPSRRHYGNYPQIEDGVGMVRSFLDKFERLFRPGYSGKSRRSKFQRLNSLAATPDSRKLARSNVEIKSGSRGTIFTGEMFAPILAESIRRFNSRFGGKISVVSVPNEYFGGDVSVAGLISGRDFLDARDKVSGDFVIIPKHAIKSDEPVLIDGIALEDLRRSFSRPIIPADTDELISILFSVRQP
ncbi:MAG: hypothetical protein C4325_11000 [Blastocatellia bacterium]